jgi:hypothetical protein
MVLKTHLVLEEAMNQTKLQFAAGSLSLSLYQQLRMRRNLGLQRYALTSLSAPIVL